MKVEIERQIDNLSKHQYVFWFDENARTLWVDEYNLLERESPRHNYKIKKQYKRIPMRSNLNNLTKEQVPLSDEIKEAAINSLISQVKVEFWLKN